MFRRLPVLAVSAVLGLALAASSSAATIQLRVEGLTQTLFDGSVTTSAHDVGGHVCDGTNGGANSAPGPTMTGALDETSLSWSGTWFDSFDDFSIDTIGPDSSDLANNRFWGLVLNGAQTQVGGCQQQIEDGDEVLFAYDVFSKAHVLKLRSEQNVAAINTGVVYTVSDAQTGQPVEGASVGGKTTDASGHATVFYATTGTQTVKAEKSESIRSNRFTTCVYDPAAGGCGFAAAAKPPPTTASGGGTFTPPTVPSCSSISVSGGPLHVGRRSRVQIVVSLAGAPVSGVQVRLRGDGVDVRRITDGAGMATAELKARRPGTIRVGVYGEIRRCGVEGVPARRG